MIKAVFFDLGDTLCDYEGAAGVAIDSACEYAVGHAQGLSVGGLREAYLRDLRHTEEDALRWTASRQGRSGPQEGFRLWERALEKCGIVNPILAHAAALHYELSRIRALTLLPDALPAVQALQGRVHVGLIAEGSPGTVNEELTLLGLRGLLASVLIDEEVGYSRLDPQLFSHGVREAGCEPAQVAHVGDSLKADVAPAHAAGLVTVWVNRAGAKPRADLAAPDHTVPDLQPLPELLLGKA
jgi:FMN phosphatase YigB (HAD superfamily)